MSALAEQFINNLLPIFLATAAGYPLGRWLKVSARSLSQVIFYIFTPCLVFVLLTDNRISGNEVARMIGFALTNTLLIGLIALGAGLTLRLTKPVLMAVLLTVMFTNAGNIGLPLNQFAFGNDALAQATIFFVTGSILTNILGAFLASMGTYRLRDSFIEILKLPMLYALILAFVFIETGWTLPLPVARTVRLLSDASVPSMLVLLGVQLQSAHWEGKSLPLILSGGLRLLVAPLLAIGLSLVFGLQGAARQAGVLEASMPSAVLTTVLAIQYDCQPELVTTTVVITTLLSPLMITPLLVFLGR